MKANYRLNCYILLFHGICYWEWFSSWKAVVALPWWLWGFVALSIDLALLISLVLLHVQLSEEKWAQGCELSQKFLQNLKSTVPYFFFLTRQLSNFLTSLLFFTSLQTLFPTHLYLSSAVSFSWCFCFSFRAPKTFFSNRTLNRSQNTKSCHFFTSQISNTWFLTNFINIAASDLAGGPSTLQRQEWEANASLQFFFL